MDESPETKVMRIVKNVVRHLERQGVETTTECWNDGSECNIHALIQGAQYKIQIMDLDKGIPMAWRLSGSDEITLGSSENRSPTATDRLVLHLCREINERRFHPPEAISPARFRYTKGWLVFYTQAASSDTDVGEEDFTEVARRIQDERLRGTESAGFGYDVILGHVREGEKLFPTLVVTTNDPGSKDYNAVLSNLFQHNNPKMHGSVESFSPGDLQQLLNKSEATKAIHFDAVKTLPKESNTDTSHRAPGDPVAP